MKKIDINLAIDIAACVEESSYTDLSGMVTASKFFNSLVYSTRVHNKVSLREVLANAAFVNLDSPLDISSVPV